MGLLIVFMNNKIKIFILSIFFFSILGSIEVKLNGMLKTKPSQNYKKPVKKNESYIKLPCEHKDLRFSFIDYLIYEFNYISLDMYQMSKVNFKILETNSENEWEKSECPICKRELRYDFFAICIDEIYIHETCFFGYVINEYLDENYLLFKERPSCQMLENKIKSIWLENKIIKE